MISYVTDLGSGGPLNYGVQMDDSEVVAAIAAGDPAGLAAAYDTYAAPLYGYCRWMLSSPGPAAEALRETFAVAAAKLGGLKDPGQLRAWLYGIARDECCRQLRTVEAGFDEAADGEDQVPETGPQAQQAEVRRLILATLADLKPQEHEVIELSVRHNLDETELAAVLEVSWSRAHTLASQARDHLEKALDALLIARTGRSPARSSPPCWPAGTDGARHFPSRGGQAGRAARSGPARVLAARGWRGTSAGA
jgi:RNA polymerase sigma factor (sigma-70 family)